MQNRKCKINRRPETMVLRFTDGDVKQNLEGVVHGIRNWIDEHGI